MRRVSHCFRNDSHEAATLLLTLAGEEARSTAPPGRSSRLDSEDNILIAQIRLPNKREQNTNDREEKHYPAAEWDFVSSLRRFHSRSVRGSPLLSCSRRMGTYGRQDKVRLW
jgi:hypothetical protein